MKLVVLLNIIRGCLIQVFVPYPINNDDVRVRVLVDFDLVPIVTLIVIGVVVVAVVVAGFGALEIDLFLIATDLILRGSPSPYLNDLMVLEAPADYTDAVAIEGDELLLLLRETF
jgi:hypothetical protein